MRMAHTRRISREPGLDGSAPWHEVCTCGSGARAALWRFASFGLPRVITDFLYGVNPALHRLEQQGWIKSEWRPTETGRMAKFYSLTRSGRRQMEKKLASWTRLSAAINLVVQEV